MTTIDSGLVARRTINATNRQQPNKTSQHTPEYKSRFSGTEKSWFRTPLTSAALLAASVGLFPASQARAEISPEAGAVVKWATQGLYDKTGKARDWKDLNENDWNNLRVGLRVTDNTKELDMHPVRIRILQEAPRNPHIPLSILHEAINTAGVLGQNLEDSDLAKSPFYKDKGLKAADLKAEISSLLLSYTERVVGHIDFEKDKQIQSRRTLFAPEELAGAGGVKEGDFRKSAKNALARTAHQDTLKQVVKAFLEADNNPTVRAHYFDILRQTPKNVQVPELEAKLQEWIFGKSDESSPHHGLDLGGFQDGELPGVEGEQAGLKAKPALKTLSSSMNDTIPAHLKAKKLTYLSSDNRARVADAIVYLADRDHKMALPAASQWFAQKDYKFDSSNYSLDIKVLGALAKLAQKSPEAHGILRKVVASQTTMMVRVMASSGGFFGPSQEERDTKQALHDAMKADRVASVKLLRDMFDKKAETLWEKPTGQSDINDLEANSAMGKKLAVFLMANNPKGLFNDILRTLPNNRFEDLMTRRLAVVGLALNHDKDALETILQLAVNPVEDDDFRSLALEAALFIDKPDELPQAVKDRAYDANPFSSNLIGEFLSRGKDGKMLLSENGVPVFNAKANPFRNRITAQYQKLLKSAEIQQSQARAGGRLVEPISDQQKLDFYASAYRSVLGSSQGTAFGTLAGKADAQKRYMQPLVDYLQRKEVDFFMALPSMEVLGKSGYRPAADVLLDITKTPEKYFFNPATDDMDRLELGVIGTTLMRMSALQGLGGTLAPNDPRTEVLHTMLKDPFIQYQFASLTGLGNMAENGKARLGHIKGTLEKADLKAEQADALKKEQAELTQGLEANGVKMINHLKRLQAGVQDLQQRRRVRDFLSYETAKVAHKLGAEKALLEFAKEAQQKDPRAGVARSIGQAILSNNYDRDGLTWRKYDDPLLKAFNERSYWEIDKLQQLGLSGQGAEHAHFDVGHINPVTPELEKTVTHPSWTRWEDENNWMEPHPTGTVETIRQVAPGLKIYSYNVAEDIKGDEHAPALANDALIYGLEDLLQRQILPEGHKDKTHVTTTNHSYGFTNAVMYAKDMREQLLDFTSAYMQALGETGVTNFVSAGNSQAAGPFGIYDPVGSVNTLGSRIDKDGKVTKNKNTVLVSAVDGYAKVLAEFSSIPNPLRLDEALEMVGAPGYQEMTLYKDMDGKWSRIPVDGTSFSGPNAVGASQLIDNARKSKPALVALLLEQADKNRLEAGLPALTQEQRTAAMKASAEALNGREQWETGYYISPMKFLIEAIKQK